MGMHVQYILNIYKFCELKYRKFFEVLITHKTQSRIARKFMKQEVRMLNMFVASPSKSNFKRYKHNNSLLT